MATEVSPRCLSVSWARARLCIYSWYSGFPKIYVAAFQDPLRTSHSPDFPFKLFNLLFALTILAATATAMENS